MAKVKNTLGIQISTAVEGILWRGEGTSLSSENSQGPFDILLGHANFVTIIHGKPIVIRQKKTVIKKLTPRTAVIYVKGSTVKVYTEI